MTAADKYYLKAAEYYPYEIEQVVEALEYGLACDNEHAGLLTLMGKVYACDLRQFDTAREHFELALFHDPYFVDAYYAYIKLAIVTDDFARADKLIACALKLKGIDRAYVLYFQAIGLEKQNDFGHAMESMKQAAEYSLEKKSTIFYQEELERIKQKQKTATERKAQINIMLV